ncbi:hypothetical protein ACF0H5_007364 [Mactra antiquata]
MTVGLDLKSLENLRIYNGHEKEKNQRRLSWEAPSSPESDVSHHDNNTTGRTHKPKCGRPANPIPRHKRDSHIKAEYKRRDKIQKGFDMLVSLVPELSDVSAKESKSTMLFKTAEHCRRLDSERDKSQKELTALRQELEALGTEIQSLQDKLPCHGVDTMKDQDTDISMDTLYDQYIQDETKKNWKFWIFGYFMRPLYESFKQNVDGKNQSREFESSVSKWVQNTLSLTNLRKGFLDALRRISKYTSIMTNPEKLEEESKTKMGEHRLSTNQDSSTNCGLFPTPPGTPRAPTPAPVSSAGRTPATTPATTPPRTPNVSRKSSKCETHKSRESRSRSNSPEEVRHKRRSSYRSRSGKRSPGASFREEKDIKMEFAPISSVPTMPLLSHLLTSPQSARVEPVVMVTSSNNVACMLPAGQSQVNNQITPVNTSHSLNHKTPPVDQRYHGNETEDKKILTSFIESLFSEKPQMQFTVPKPVSETESKPRKYTVVTASMFGSSCQNTTTTTLEASTSSTHQMDTSTFSSTTQALTSFIPLCSSGVISNNSVLQAEPGVNSLSDCLTSPMDVIMLTESNSDLFLNSLEVFEAQQESNQIPMTTIDQNNTSHTITSIDNITRTDTSTSLLPQDEDSLTGLLGLDVMDVNSVITFFNEDKSQS